MIAAQSSVVSRDLCAYALLCDAEKLRNCTEIRAAADKAQAAAKDPELVTFASMVSAGMTINIHSGVGTIEECESLNGLFRGTFAAFAEPTQAIKAATLMMKGAWYHDLGDTLDKRYGTSRVAAIIIGWLICGGLAAAAGAAVCWSLGRTQTADDLEPVQQQPSPAPQQSQQAPAPPRTEADGDDL
ncbi:MAG: hypothetical protein NTW87_28485 [Planctomycetota bacterium]|nr:hypothetical protein [Planctomycetota bacterium]